MFYYFPNSNFANKNGSSINPMYYIHLIHETENKFEER